MIDSREVTLSLFEMNLEKYLAGKDYSDLSEARNTGEMLMDEGIGEADIVKVYSKLMAEGNSRFVVNGKDASMQRSLDFLEETLAPFTYRFMEKNEQIRELQENNDKLRRELAACRQNEQTLSRSKEYYQSLLEHSLDIIAILNLDGTVRYMSPSVKRVMGYDPGEIIGRKIIDYIHHDQQEYFNTWIEDTGQTGTVDSSEFRIRHKSGSWHYIESNFSKITEKGEAFIVVNARDITRRMGVRKKLIKSQNRLVTAQQIARLGNWEWNLRNDKLKWSREISRMFRIDHREAPSTMKGCNTFIHEDDRDYVAAKLQEAIEEEKHFEFEYRVSCMDGYTGTLLWRGEVMRNGRGKAVKLIGTAQDITRFKRTENKLRKYRDQLRSLSVRQDRIREEERANCCTEIHDELGQMLTVLKMDFFFLEQKAKDEFGERFANLSREMNVILDKIDVIIDSVQRITLRLRPEELDNFGLVEAIEWQCRDFENRTGINVDFSNHLSSDTKIDNERSTVIFRILQEGLTNVQLHADAKNIDVELNEEGDRFVLKILDDGIGIPEGSINDSASLGIIGMRERSIFLGGEIKFSRRKKGGTMVTLKIPWNES